MKQVKGGVTAAKGFEAASTAAGIKYKDRTDMALVYSQVPCVAAGTFTTNVVKAAPVKWDQQVVKSGAKAQAVVVNSGIANTCTGAEGFGYCKDTADAAAKALNISADGVLIGSTGVIGKQIPIDKLTAGIEALAGKKNDTLENGTEAAKAIMTTDTFPKELAVTIEVGGKTVTIGGMAKGSGMIHPNMCTMLAFVTTDAVITKEALQKWVDYANKNGCVIIYDAAYEAYISEENVPHSIYECEGARTCAIELRSFSKNAGFTGVRLGFTVIPKELVRDGVSLHSLWARRHGTKFNGAPYIVQKAGEAVYSEAGKAQLKDQVGYYMRNAKLIHDELTKAGFSVSGGVNAPYIWLETPDKMTSWEFFDYLLKNANVVGTPGSGFGSHGEGYFRLTAFGTYENTLKAIDRIKSL